MSCGEKGNDDEFDPIPVLISKNSNQGKVNRIPRWAVTPAEAQNMSLKDDWLSAQIQSDCDCWIEMACMGVLVTLRLFFIYFFLSHQALTLVIFLSFVIIVTLPVVLQLAGVWLCSLS